MADEDSKTEAEAPHTDDVCSDDTVTEKSETLKKYEEMFANRFTAEDEEYQRYVSRPADPPPIVEDWGGRSGGRDNRHHDRGGYRGRGWGGDRGWRGDRGWGGDHRDRHWDDRDRDRNRHGGHGSGYHSGPPNSYNQRPQYDRY